MKGDAGRELIGALADAVTGGDPASSERVTGQLAQLSGPGWLRLDETARRPYWRPSPLDAVADWGPFLTASAPPAAVVAASMSRDGRVREPAVSLLAHIRAPVAATALAVRVADWVPEVSSAAWAAVSARTGPDDATAIVPVFLALSQRRRGRQFAARYLASLAEGPAATLQTLAAARDRAGKLWALQTQTKRNLLTADILADRAMRDPDPVIALWCARSLADPSGQLPTAAGQRLLSSARAGVRAFAVGHLGDDQCTTHALQALLVDRSGAVRSMARWRWRRLQGDPGPVYRSVLADTDMARQIAAALQGLDEGNDGSLPELAVPFLAHPSPRVRRAAAQAVGRHGEPGDNVDYLAPLLLDSSAKVAAVALRHARGNALPASVLARLDAADTPRSRQMALSLRQRSGTWDRVHADLAAINGQDSVLAETARADLLAWLQHGAATTYGRPGPGRTAEIAGLLATRRLSDAQRREVAFVAGIRLAAARSQPG